MKNLNSSLLYIYEKETPSKFCDIRIVENELWIRSGKTQTWGEKDVIVCTSKKEAEHLLITTTEGKIKEGWTLARQRNYQPGKFDFKKLTEEILEGSRQAFAALHKSHPDKNFCAFCLYSDEDASTIVHAGLTQEFLQKKDEPEHYLWNVSEWPYDQGGEFLDIAYRMILPVHQDVPFDFDEDDFSEGVFNTCIKALEQLKNENFFNRLTNVGDIILLFQVTDSDDLYDDAVKKLNSAKNYKRWQAWLKHCEDSTNE